MGNPKREIINSQETAGVSEKDVDKLIEEEENAPMETRQKLKPYIRPAAKIGRNEPCPCGRVDRKGKPLKFKKCCGDH